MHGPEQNHHQTILELLHHQNLKIGELKKFYLQKIPFLGKKDYRTRLFKYWLTQIEYSYPANYVSESELPDKLYIYSPKMLQGMGARVLDTMESRIRGIVPWSFTDIST